MRPQLVLCFLLFDFVFLRVFVATLTFLCYFLSSPPWGRVLGVPPGLGYIARLLEGVFWGSFPGWVAPPAPSGTSRVGLHRPPLDRVRTLLGKA